jgi:phospholipid/cholesterol/gamma-HCH transport system substrate-binding protein
LERIAQGADAIQGMGKTAGAASQEAAKAVAAAGADMQQLAAQTGPPVQLLLAEMQLLSGSLRRLSEQLERNPNSALTGRAPKANGPGETSAELAPP